VVSQSNRLVNPKPHCHPDLRCRCSRGVSVSFGMSLIARVYVVCLRWRYGFSDAVVGHLPGQAAIPRA